MSSIYLRYVVERKTGSVPAFTVHLPIEDINKARHVAAKLKDQSRQPYWKVNYSSFTIVAENKTFVIERL